MLIGKQNAKALHHVHDQLSLLCMSPEWLCVDTQCLLGSSQHCSVPELHVCCCPDLQAG